MESSDRGWWSRHGWTVALLLTAFSLAFAIRTIWSYPVIAKWGALYVYAGGSDSYYHSRVMQYIILTGHNLIHDPMLKYPIGGTNPREPLFDWMNAILGLLFAPFFGGNAVVAGAWFLDLQAPLWAALEVFPLYLIGREVSGKRTGIIAAMILPFLSANITSSTFGYANYLSFYTFMILVVIYSYLRTLKALGTHRYVDSYRNVGSLWGALKSFYYREHTAVKWSVFTGVSLGALALSWQGYTDAIVVIGFTLLIAMLIERIRRVDSFGLYVATWIIGLIAIPMMLPYYLVQGDLRTFFDLPVLLLFGVLALMLPFLLMRDVPWVFSIPSLVALVAAAAVFLKVVLPGYFSDIVTGQGYFVKTLIYSTVAEAQPPSFDALVLGYGVATFFLAFVGLAIFAWLLAHHRFKRYHIALLVYGVVSLYLPISATKFFLVGSPAYALLSAEALNRALEVGRYPELRRSVASLSDRGSQFGAFQRSFKPRHALILALVLVIVMPNVWIALDAGIPGNTKDAVAAQINDTIPSFLKLNASEPADNYLGATGSEMDTPNQYDFAAYTWLSHQDTNVPEPQRPAFVSWWDYGFQAIDQGQHPSVADNFQNGIDPAGQFLLAQNESLAIAVLATTLLSAEEVKNHAHTLPSGLATELHDDGVNVTELEHLLADESADFATVVAHPDVYLPVDASTLTDDNAMYLAVEYYLAGKLSENRVAQVYDTVQEYTGWSIRYAAVDSRLFPFSGTDTGIFYAPADLTGRVINSEGLPTSFFNVTVLGTNNETYPLGSVPADVGASQYEINYFAPFYNSMLYRTYIGYNGTDVGQDGGIPGLEGAAASDPLEPGFMLQHFEIVYRTAYYCAGVKNATNSSSCMLPANYPEAKSVAKSTNGTFDGSAISYFQGGETMLAYYPGVTLDGIVSTNHSTPDQGVRVTVYDGWGIPHMSDVTNANGSFSLVLPPGNDTINITTGTFDKKTQADATVLKSVKITVPDSVGYSFDAAPIVERFPLSAGTVQGVVYWNTANNSSYRSTDTVVTGAKVLLTPPGSSTPLAATTDASGTFRVAGVPPGNYSLQVRYQGHEYNESAQLVKAGGTVNASVGLSPGKITGTVTATGGVAVPYATVTLANTTGTVAVATTTSDGDYAFDSVGPGQYTVTATVANTIQRSVRTPANVGTAGQSVTVPLTVVSQTAVTVEVTDASAPAAGIPVRFSPLISFEGDHTSGLTAFNVVEQNGTVALTAADGEATTSLPIGNYTAYALGYVGGQYESAVGRLTVSGSGTPPTLSLELTPVKRVTGTVTQTVSSGSSAVLAVAASGAEVVTETAANGSYALSLPAGTYNFLALQGTTGPSGETDAAIGRLNVSSDAALSFDPTPAASAQFAVYANLTADTTVPVANATVTITAGPDGPGISQTAGANGTIGFYLPESLPSASGGYCLSGSAPGYSPSTECGIAPSALGSLSTFRLSPAPIPVTISVTGVPTGTSVLLNITAKSSTAVSRNLTGGPRFSLKLTPGDYSITAYASADGGKTVYAPATPYEAVVKFGIASATLSIPVLAEILAHGTLSLPSGTSANNTTVKITSSVQDVTVNGTAYEDGFRISVGSFTAAVNATGTLGDLSNLTGITVASGGTISPRLVLNRAGVSLTGDLIDAATNATESLNGTIALHGASGSTIRVSVTKGSFSTTVPVDHNFTVTGSFTVRTIGTNGSYRESWTVVAGSSCAVGTTTSSCTVPLRSSLNAEYLNGSLVRAGLTGAVAGTLRLIGPYPSTNVTVLDLANGTFSLEVAPGTYYLYATPADGSSYAGFATATALPGAHAPIAVTLLPATVDQVTIANSGATGQTVGTATLSVTGTGGDRLSYDGIAPGTTLSILLPSGTYKLRATSAGTLNGIAGNATAHASVAMAASGNLATRLALAVPQIATVIAALTGPHGANVTAGGSVTFDYTFRASGNVPVTVHPVGSPSLWKFNFSIANVTVVPGGSRVTGEVRIHVPNGTAVAHEPVAISLELANGTAAGVVTPAPTVTVAPFTGLDLGRTTSAFASVGTTTASVPFYLHDAGNVPEEVRLTVTNAGSLTALGWSYAFGKNSTDRPLTLNLSAFSNATYALNLTFTGTAFIAPSSVTIQATLLNTTVAIAPSITVPVKETKIEVTSSTGQTLVVTGPGVGSSSTYLGEWELLLIALVPAILLVALIVVHRWWTTRRWSKW